MNKLVNVQGNAIDSAPVLVSTTGEALTPPAKRAPAPTQPEAITPFEDGYLFKFARNPKKNDTFILHTVDGHVIGIIQHPEMARMICEAVKLLSFASKELSQVKADENVVALDNAESSENSKA